MPVELGFTATGDGGLPFIRRHSTLLFVVVLCLSLAIRLYYTRTVPYRLGADEGVDLKYARVVGQEGVQTLSSLTAEYLQNEPGLWPPPTRVGFVVPAALAMRLLADGTPRPLTYVSTLMFAAFLATAFWFIHRNGLPEIAFA